MTPWARFDDLRAGTALAFPTVRRVLAAERAEDVVAVLDEVERATDAGWWAFGYVSYEAAGALDPSLAVHPPAVDPVPLVWFGLCDGPVPVPPLDAGPWGEGTAGEAVGHEALAPGVDAGRARPGRRPGPGADRTRRHLPVQPDGAGAREGRGRPA